MIFYEERAATIGTRCRGQPLSRYCQACRYPTAKMHLVDIPVTKPAGTECRGEIDQKRGGPPDEGFPLIGERATPIMIIVGDARRASAALAANNEHLDRGTVSNPLEISAAVLAQIQLASTPAVVTSREVFRIHLHRGSHHPELLPAPSMGVCCQGGQGSRPLHAT